MSYGLAGIEDGLGSGDIISNNIIYRSKQRGIFGTFDHCIINNNLLSETNYDNLNISSMGGTTDGGILLLNNPNFGTPSGNRIHDNMLFTPGSHFTVPVDYLDADSLTRIRRQYWH